MPALLKIPLARTVVYAQTPPPPHTPIESGGTYARSPLPEPSFREKEDPLSLVLVTIGNYTKSTAFPGFSLEISPETSLKTYHPLSRKNGNRDVCGPSRAFEQGAWPNAPSDLAECQMDRRRHIRENRFVLFIKKKSNLFCFVFADLKTIFQFSGTFCKK